MPTYERGGKELRLQIETEMEKHHGPLADAKVWVDVLLAHPSEDAEGEPTGDAIVVNGYKAVACIKILSLKQRVARQFDAELTLDADHWEMASDAEQAAIIDHELTHLELKVSDEGVVKRDDAERPMMRTRKHDIHTGWFSDVARRHGEASLEVKQARTILDSLEFKQYYLFELEETEEGDDLVTLQTKGKAPRRMSRAKVADTVLKEAKEILGAS